MKKLISFVMTSCLVIGMTACSDDESSNFIYYGGDSNPDAIITIDDREHARRAYFKCVECQEDYDIRYLEDGDWLWDQKTCRKEETAMANTSLFCLRDRVVKDFSVEEEAFSFSDGGCDFVIPKIGEPEFPGSQSLQQCDVNENVSEDKLYCENMYIALDKEETCSFDVIDEVL